MSPTNTTESAFEAELVEHLTAHGWEEGDPKDYRARLALDPKPLLAFVKETQPDEWKKLESWHNGDTDDVFLKRVRDVIDTIGVIAALRHGVKDKNARFDLCQFRPAFGTNEKILADYEANRLTVTRQVHYSPHRKAESIDLVLFLNGIPVATAELKTDLTQSIDDAKKQYRQDRPPKDPKTNAHEPLLQHKTGAIVHFAVSTDEVWMTTRLAGNATYFLPFNKGHKQGAGNPPTDGYPTSYLWQEIWQRDAWLEILGRYVYVERVEETDPETGRKKTKEVTIFPRYHQRSVVKAMVAAAQLEGPGHRYLAQHSAGSGKTKSISWLSHQLSDLHDDDDERVFDSVVVITDRTVLDSQLQDAIYEIDHVDGVVARIDKDSSQLAEALEKGRKIIVSTLQKFPFVLEKVGDLAERRYAVIIDEAHSSQTGKAAHKLREVLSELGEEVDEDEDVTAEDVMLAAMEKRRPPPNVSFFAFTATPKPKTIEMFGRPGPDGKPQPFHVYSMRQAIEEEFILDVLKHYVSYKTLYKLATTEGDREVSESKARRAISKYLSLHPHNIAQKVEIIVEHFREKVMPKIGGKAKAMVVTDSRKAAVRYKVAMDKYMKAQGYHDMGTLVAFSGSVDDPETGPDPFTEGSLNDGISDPKIKRAFAKAHYRVLIVANKYQTGFDQPLLHTMYVDKKLDGVRAVQTLSRLNRIHPEKRDTCVVDFRNDPEAILEAFKPFYRTARLSEVTDPNVLHDLATKLRDMRIFLWPEVEGFAKAFYNPKGKQAALHGFLKPAADRYREAKPEVQATFRKDLGTFVRGYEFLSMVVPYADEELESLAVFGKALAPRLGRPVDDSDSGEDAIRLTHFRIQKTSERELSLEDEESTELYPATKIGTAKVRESKHEKLSVIIRELNDLFAGELDESDLVTYAEHVSGRLAANPTLAAQAQSNSMEQFALGDYGSALEDAVIDGLELYNGMAKQLIDDERKFERFARVVLPMIYRRLRERESVQDLP